MAARRARTCAYSFALSAPSSSLALGSVRCRHSSSWQQPANPHVFAITTPQSQPLSAHRRSSSSSLLSSSFDAPEPPTSHGHPVFPDIQFISGDSEERYNAATRRNADPEAVFVVTGANRGIGLQFVISLLRRTEGKVVACCRSPSGAEKLNSIASKDSHRLQVVPFDIEHQSSIDALAYTVGQRYGRVDALFNVAGILGDGTSTPGPERSLANIERAWMEKNLAVNVIGPTMLTQALSPLLRSKGRRSVSMEVKSENGISDTIDVALPINRPPTVVVNLSARVGSISDNQLGGWYSYRISKAALNQSTRTLGLELRRQGTWIVALHPGTTDTDLSKPFQGNVREGRLFPVEFTVDKLMDVVESLSDRNTGGFYDWAGKALPF